jgi:hypothetical protein
VKCASLSKKYRNFNENKLPVKRAVKIKTHREVKYFPQYTFSAGRKENIKIRFIFFKKYIFYIKRNVKRVKGKAIPLQAWTGPEGSRRLRVPDFKTIGT